jgi:glycosyltransferase involved in cell wall biosynthesis
LGDVTAETSIGAVDEKMAGLSGPGSGRPVWDEVGVIALVPDYWEPKWQPRHQVLSRLARYFHVVWVDYPPGWRKSLSARRMRRAAAKNAPPPPPNFEVYEPELFLPRVGRPAWLGRLLSKQRLKRASDRLRARGCTKVVLYVWRPEFAAAIHETSHDLSVYHIDDEYTFSPTEKEISPAERSLLESVGQVFIHSVALMRKKGGFNPCTEFVPNGVDYTLYATAVPEPEDLRSISRPRIGYVGWIKRMLDWGLLLQLASSHPQWSFVLVGPTAPHPEIDGMVKRMSGLPNVHFLGGKPTSSLGAYPQHFDVCTMPYRLDDYTKYIYPLKMHEYLASGRPVVSAPICSVQEFADIIGVATSPEEWSDAIEHALSEEENSAARRELRLRTAREHDWEVLVDKIAHTIGQRLGCDPSSVKVDAGVGS